MEIAFIAPHEDIKRKADSVIKAFNFPACTYLGDLVDGVSMAQHAIENGAKIIISRGGTARRIRDELGIAVIEVEPSYANALSYIHHRTTNLTRIAITGFGPFVNIAQSICEVLGKQYKTFEIISSFDNQIAETVFAEVLKWKADVVIGDAISVRLAKQEALHFHLIDSSTETIVEAFERALLILNNLQRHLANAEKLTTVLNCAQQGVILLNKDGMVEESNEYACVLLNIDRQKLIGHYFTELFDSAELNVALKSGREAKNIIVNCDNAKVVINSVRIHSIGEAQGAVILFQPLKQIQDTETSVRKKLFSKGFTARHHFENITHCSQPMDKLVLVARQYSATSCNIMIHGETGTGKELFAQSIHNASALRKGPFVAVNCAAIPGPLLESELFGYAPGAFTGALRSGKEGLFELAHGGTLFLDEITEMEVFLQSRLLRVLQEHEIMRVGDNKVIPVQVRVIAASNRILEEEIHKGHLRTDLLYRLNVLDLYIPPLRERKEDIGLLFSHYLSMYGKKYAKPIPVLTRYMTQRLEEYRWPGNVRELENMAEKYVVLHGTGTENDLFEAMGEKLPLPTQQHSLQSIIGEAVQQVLRDEQGNISKTAARLEVDRNTVKRWIDKNKKK